MKKAKKIIALVASVLVIVSAFTAMFALADGTEVIWKNSFDTDEERAQWSFSDLDGDTKTWMWKSSDMNAAYTSYDGTYMMYSESKDEEQESLTPDNCAASDTIEITETDAPDLRINWFVAIQSIAHIEEHYSVYVIKDNDSLENLDSYDPVFSETLTEKVKTYHSRSVDITDKVKDLFGDEKSERKIRIVFRHHESTGNFALKIDAVSVEAYYNYDMLAEYDFEDGLQGWTTIDGDGDGHNWEHKTSATHRLDGYLSDGCMASASYDDETLTPENYIISPEIEISRKYSSPLLSWYVGSYDEDYYAENYSLYVYLGTESLTSSNIKGIVSGLKPVYSETLTTYEYSHRNVDLGRDYAGQKVRLIFVHHNCSDIYWLKIDNVVLKAYDNTSPIDEIKVTGISKPVVGEPFSSDGYTASFTSDGKTVTLDKDSVNLVWQEKAYNEESGEWEYTDVKTDVFTTGVTYRACVTVSVSEDYIFTDSTATDEGATLISKDTGSLHTATVAYEFYSVTWKGNSEETVYYTEGEEINAPEVPVKTGYTFKGWDTTIPEKMPANNMTITATWDANSYNAVFDANGGSWTDGDTSKTVPTDYDSDIVAPADPAKTGYNFGGWLDADENPVGIMDDINGKTFTAVWNAKGDTPYTVNIYTMGTDGEYGAADVKNLTGTTDTKVTYTPDIATGFELNASSVTEGTVAADGSLVLDIYIDRTTYTLTTIVDGTDTTSTDYRFGAAVTVATPIKEGHTFSGWDKDVPATMPAEDVTLTGSFTANVHSVTYYVDGAEHFSEDVAYGTEVRVLAPLTKEGYTFSGWVIDDKAAEDFKMPDEDVVINGTWTINKHSVIYMVDGAQYSKIDDIEYGSNVTLIAEPSKEGYTFSGWVIDDKAAEDFKMPDADVTISGTFTANDYTITFDSNGGSAVASITQAYGTAITAPSDPTKTGYEFKGWDKEIPATMPAGDMTITAQWEIKQYTISFVDTGDVAYEDITKNYGEAVGTVADPVKTGYRFVSWDKEIPATMPAEDTVITAVWAINEYSITFDMDGGDSIAPIVQNYGTDIDASAIVPNKTGYVFAGWVDANGDAAEIPATMPAENITLTATWELDQFTFTFVVYEGTEVGPLTLDYKAAIDADALTSEKEGYTFLGWALNENPEEADKVDLPATMPAEDRTYYAIWKLKEGCSEYSIETYTMDTTGAYGAPTVDTKASTTDADVSVIPEAKTGFTLDTDASILEGKVAADGLTTLKVYYIRDQYTLKTIVDGAETSSTAYYYEAVVAVATPSKTGYTFSGWDKTVPATMPAEDVTLTGSFTANVHSVTYYVDSVEHFSEDVAYGTDVTVLAPLAKEGYTFSGWDKTDFTMPDEDVVINGTWTINKYDVIYMVDGKEYDRTENVAYGTDVTVLAPLTKTGYTFSGWDKADFTMPDAEVTINGSWTAINYTVTWVDGIDTTEDQVDTYIYEAEIIAPADPVKAGYTFTGWQDADGNTYAEGATMPAANVVYTAQWTGKDGIAYTVITYKMNSDGTTYAETSETLYGTAGEEATAATTLDVEGFTFNAEKSSITGTIAGDGSLVLKVYYDRNKITVDVNGDKDEYYYDDEITEPETPVDPDGGEFKGWEDEDGEPVDFPYNVPDEEDKEITITPIYYYTVKYVADGAEVLVVENRAGTTYTVPDATKAGYTFAGWTLDGADAGLTVGGDATIPVGGATYVAEFTANDGIAYTVITYKMNSDGTTYAETSETLYGTAGEEATAATPDAEGFTFNAEKSSITGTIAGDGSLVLKVYYDRNKITVDVNGEKDEYFYDDEITEPETPVDPNGGEFKGWEDEYGEPVDFPYNVPDEEDKEITITPVYNYTVVYTSDNAEVYSIKDRAGTTYTVPAATKTGYTFNVWTLDGADAGLTVGGDATIPVGGATYIASWNVNSYKLGYRANGGTFPDGSDIKEFMIPYGTAKADWDTPEMPEKTGYTFTGWNTETAPATMPAEDMTITATWKANSYNAVFDANGGSWTDGDTSKTVPTDYNESIVAPEAPAKIGYTFGGWTPAVGKMDDVNGKTFTAIWNANGDTAYTVSIYTMDTNGSYGEPEVLDFTAATDSPVSYGPEAKKGFTLDGDNNVLDGTVAPDGSTNLEVYYIRNQYTFKTVDDGKETTETYYFDEAVTAPSDPTKTGYEFKGWDKEIPATMPAGDMTITAQWEIKQYTISFVDTGDVAYEDITKNYGEAVGTVADPVKTGYRFVSWDKTIPSTMPAENMTITAKWNVNSYTVTWIVDGKKTETPVEYGKKITKPADPTKTGYNFVGWSPAVPEKMPAKNLEFEAEFSLAISMSIGNPSLTTISYGDSITLHAKVNGVLPLGWSVKWTADNARFSYTPSSDGITCKITPSSSGSTVFTATVYDETGKEIVSDTQTMNSKAGFFDKIIGTIKGWFGLTKHYDS